MGFSRHIAAILGEDTNEDAATITLSLVPSSADIAGYLESATEPLLLVPSGTDIITGNVEAATENLLFSISSVDTAEHIDAATESFVLTVSGVDLRVSLDSATEDLRFTITTHECYFVAQPEYFLTVFKRWNMQIPFANWEVSSVDKRWNCFLIGTTLDVIC